MRPACDSGKKCVVKLPSPRALFALGFFVPVALVVSAIVLTVGYHVAACPLCIVQRMLYLSIAVVSLLGLVSQRVTRVVAALIAVAASAAGAVIAGYQIYLQRNPFSATCGDGSSWWEQMVEQAGNALPLFFKADGLCSDATWSLIGVSIVESSLLAFCGLLVGGLLALFSSLRR